MALGARWWGRGQGPGTALYCSSSTGRALGWKQSFSLPQEILLMSSTGSIGALPEEQNDISTLQALSVHRMESCHSDVLSHGGCQPEKVQQKPFTAAGCLLGRRLCGNLLSNHCCACMQYKCGEFTVLPVMPDVHSSSFNFSVRVSHAVQLFMGFAHLVFGSPCCV